MSQNLLYEAHSSGHGTPHRVLEEMQLGLCCRFAVVGTYAGWFYLRFIKVSGAEGTQLSPPYSPQLPYACQAGGAAHPATGAHQGVPA